jgi:hypothetical protein
LPYFYNNHTGLYAIESGVLAVPYESELHLGLGWHEYATVQQMNTAVKLNNWPGPFLQGAGNPTGIAGQITGETGGTISAAASNAANITGLPAIGDFFNRLTQANTWVRVGEVVAGLILLYVGVNALTRDTAVGNAVNSANQAARHAVKDTAMVAPK